MGGFVQMEGFLSTTLDYEKALEFYKGDKKKNTLIEIKIEVNKLGGELDWGFANIQEYS